MRAGALPAFRSRRAATPARPEARGSAGARTPTAGRFVVLRRRAIGLVVAAGIHVGFALGAEDARGLAPALAGVAAVAPFALAAGAGHSLACSTAAHVAATPPGAAIPLDGRRLDRLTPVRIEVGRHAFARGTTELRADGREPVAAELAHVEDPACLRDKLVELAFGIDFWPPLAASLHLPWCSQLEHASCRFDLPPHQQAAPWPACRR